MMPKPAMSAACNGETVTARLSSFRSPAMLSWLLLTLSLLLPGQALEAGDGLYTRSSPKPLDEVQQSLSQALEDKRFWVVFEANLGERMARFKDKWGADYNRSNLTAAKSMVFCNIWWTNRLASLDPNMLAICPLHVSLYAKDGVTWVTLLRPSLIGRDSPAAAALQELEQQLIGIIDQAVTGD